MGASIGLSASGSPGGRVRYGLAPGNADRLIFRRGPGALGLILSSLALAFAIAMGGTSPHPLGWALLAVPASLLQLWRRWAILDRRKGVVESGSGVLFPFWVRRTSLKDVGAVVLSRTERIHRTKNGSTVKTVYEVTLDGVCKPLLLGQTGMWEEAVKLAEVAAAFLALPLRDRHQQTERKPGELDEPLRDRLADRTQESTPVSPPAASRSPKRTFEAWIDSDLRRFKIPRPLEHKFLIIACFAFLFWTLPVSCFGSSLLGLLPLLFLIPAWLWTAFGFSAELEVSPRGMTVTTRGLVLKRHVRFPAAELEDLVLQTPERGGLNEILHEAFPGFLVARSDRASARFGYGLARDELERLRQCILEALKSPGEPEAVAPLPPPPPDPPLPVFYRPYWLLLGLAGGALAARLWLPTRNPCVALPFFEHVLNTWGLAGLAAALVLEPRTGRRLAASRWPRWAAALALFAASGALLLYPLGAFVAPYPTTNEKALLFSRAMREDWLFLAGLVPAGFAAMAALWAAVGGLLRAGQLCPALIQWSFRQLKQGASWAWRHRLASGAALLTILCVALLLSRNQLFFWAAAEGRTAAVQVMTGVSSSFARHRDQRGSTALHAACNRGQIGTAQALLDGGADLNARDALERTPLHMAVSDSSGRTVQFLLARGAEMNRRDRFGRTPLFLACQCNSVESARVLLEFGADPNLSDHDGQTPLRVSIRNPALITLLLNRGADPEEGGQSAWLPLHAAVSYSELASVAALLQGGANPNCRDSGGNTPLHEAACSAEPEAVEIANLLLDRGADPSLVNKAGQTALQKAQGQCPGTPVVELLHSYGAPGLPLEALPGKP